MLRKFVFLFTLLWCFAGLSFAQTDSTPTSTQTDKQKVPVVIPSATPDEKVSLIEGRVILVYDGDTLSVETKDRKIFSIWLKGVDAPEVGQDYGKKSRKSLTEFVEGKEVRVILHKKGMYDRFVGSVYLDGQDVGLRQLEAGMAWYFKRYGYEQTADERRKYAQAEQTARSEKLGLWKNDNPTAPWDFRNGTANKDNDKNIIVETPKNPTGETGGASNPTGRKYILGPRGGCYYVSESGRKVYVKDKSLCVVQ